jgi:hypothetical protein
MTIQKADIDRLFNKPTEYTGEYILATKRAVIAAGKAANKARIFSIVAKFVVWVLVAISIGILFMAKAGFFWVIVLSIVWSIIIGIVVNKTDLFVKIANESVAVAVAKMKEIDP